MATNCIISKAEELQKGIYLFSDSFPTNSDLSVFPNLYVE